jgi:hypothetical protein
MRKTRAKLTYSNVVSTLCLFMLLGGGAYAAAKLPGNSVGSRQIKKNAVASSEAKNNALKGIDIREATLGTVPTATNSKKLGGQAPNAYASSTSEPYHEVGAPGEPGFGTNWENFQPTSASTGFYKDPLGIVHLKGTISAIGLGSEAAFTLPEGYRPAKILRIGVASTGVSKTLFIDPNGDVRPDDRNGEDIGLDGVTFRAGS